MCAGACAARCLSFACAWTCVCVPRAGCVATGIWFGAVTGRCAAVVCSRMSLAYRTNSVAVCINFMQYLLA